MNHINKLLAILVLSLCCSPAWSWDGAVTGRIGALEITHDSNYGFRVWLVNEPAMCGNQNAWAYLNESDSNYKTYVAALIAARQAGDTVTIYATRDASGYCKIGHASLHSS